MKSKKKNGRSAKPIFWVCGCGCKVDFDKIIKYRSKFTKNSQQLRCPDHSYDSLSRVVGTVCRCDECGKLFDDVRACYCPQCRAKRRKESKNRSVKKYYAKHPEKINSYRRNLAGLGKDARDFKNECKFSNSVCGFCIEPHFVCSHKIINAAKNAQ